MSAYNLYILLYKEKLALTDRIQKELIQQIY